MLQLVVQSMAMICPLIWAQPPLSSTQKTMPANHMPREVLRPGRSSAMAATAMWKMAVAVDREAETMASTKSCRPISGSSILTRAGMTSSGEATSGMNRRARLAT